MLRSEITESTDTRYGNCSRFLKEHNSGGENITEISTIDSGDKFDVIRPVFCVAKTVKPLPNKSNVNAFVS